MSGKKRAAYISQSMRRSLWMGWALVASLSHLQGQTEKSAPYNNLGVFPGYNNTALMEQIEVRELGRHIPYFSQSTQFKDADSMYSSAQGFLPALKTWQAAHGPVTLVVNISPSFYDPAFVTTDPVAKVKQALLNTVSGINDARYTGTAQLLKNAGFTNAILRVGLEFDGNWMPWASSGNYPEFIAAYRHVHDLFKAVCPTFLFDFNGNQGAFQALANAYPGDTRTRAEASYPGDAYVDVIGMDVYDRNVDIPYYDTAKKAWNDPNRVWNEKFLPSFIAHRNFAISKGKPISFPEWAVQAHATIGGFGFYSGGDDPIFVENMYNWMNTLPVSGPGSLKYHCYFHDAAHTYTTSPSGPNYNINQGPTTLESPQLADSAAIYRQLYGADWIATSIGNAGTTGNAPVLNKFLGGRFVLNSASAGVNASADGLEIVQQALSGDGQIVAQVSTSRDGQGLTPNAINGVIFREDFSTGSSFALLGLDTHGNVNFVSRATAGSPSASFISSQSGPSSWLKLIRSGDDFYAYQSPDGAAWTQTASVNVPMVGAINCGLAVTSGANRWTDTGTFQNVRLDRWIPSEIYPYDSNPNPKYNYGFTTGSLGVPGSTTLDPTTGALNVSASGGGIAGTADSFYFIHQTLSGNGQIVARIATVAPLPNPAFQTGVMIRETVAPTSKSVMLSFSPNSRNQLITRSATNTQAFALASAEDEGFPWVKLVRSGTRFRYFRSSDGATWTSLGGAYVGMGSAVEIGLAVSSANQSILNSSTFDHIQVDRWNSLDIGTVGIAGYEDYNPPSGTYRIVGSGSGLGVQSDSFRYVYQTLSGDGEIVTRVSSQQINSLSSAGLMMRENLLPGSRNVAIAYAPGNGFLFTARTTENGNTTNWPGSWSPGPCWIKLQRHGDLFLGFKSTDGTTWTAVGVYNVPMPANIDVGLTVWSNDLTQLNSGVFDSGKIDPFKSTDIGKVATGGGETFDGTTGTYVVNAGGSGITSTADSCRYLYLPLTGDGEINARVLSASQFSPNTNEGVMIRETLATGARMAMMSYAFSGGFNFLNRKTQNGKVLSSPGSWSDGPYSVKLIRQGNTFTGYKSPDGVTWTPVGFCTINMAQTAYIGIAASAGEASAFNSATLDHVSITFAPYFGGNIFFH